MNKSVDKEYTEYEMKEFAYSVAMRVIDEFNPPSNGAHSIFARDCAEKYLAEYERWKEFAK